MKQTALLVVVLSLSVVAESLGRRLSAEELNSLPYSQSLNFDFGPGKVAPGYTQVLQTTTYSEELGYGFEPNSSVSCVDRGGGDALRSDLCTSDKPFFFSVALPEGNYSVTITFGDQSAETATTVKAELRRLMLEEVHTAAGKFVTRSFMVNVRTPQISTGGPEASKRAFVPNDGTHHNNYGSYELARCIVESIKANKLGLVNYLAPDLTAFDPRHPDAIDGFKLPASPQSTQIKPPGS